MEEIRVRALQNIIFKLDHDLLCVGDVVHKKELFIKLLEWFNFESCSQQKDVIQLLEKLSKVEIYSLISESMHAQVQTMEYFFIYDFVVENSLSLHA